MNATTTIKIRSPNQECKNHKTGEFVADDMCYDAFIIATKWHNYSLAIGGQPSNGEKIVL